MVSSPPAAINANRSAARRKMKRLKVVIKSFPSQLIHYAEILKEHGRLEISWYYISIIFVTHEAAEHSVQADGDFWKCHHCDAENIMFSSVCGVCSYPHPRQ